MELPPCFSTSMAVGIESCRKPPVAEYIKMRAVVICPTAYAMHAQKMTKLSIMNKAFGTKPLFLRICQNLPPESSLFKQASKLWRYYMQLGISS